MIGWIKLHRKIRNHWLWEDPVKFQWWLTMLLEVNYTEGKMKLGNQIIKVDRGSSTNSLRTWAVLFGCGTKAVTNFFELLESDEMITRKVLGKGKHSTTLINITHYSEYQSDKETLTDTLTTTLTDTQRKREGHTIKESKEEKEFKERKKRESALYFLCNNYPKEYSEFYNKYKSKKYFKTLTKKLEFQLEEEFANGKLKRDNPGAIFPRIERYVISWEENEKKQNSSNGLGTSAPRRFDKPDSEEAKLRNSKIEIG